MKVLAVAIALLFLPNTVYAFKALRQVESVAYTTNGNKAQIAERGKKCIEDIVRNDDLHISITIKEVDTTGEYPFKREIRHSSVVLPGGPVIISARAEQGSITAKSRVFVDHYNDYSVESTITFLSKDQRFKIRHTDIRHQSASSDNAYHKAYHRVGKGFGSPWKEAVAGLNRLSDAIADCVKYGLHEETW